MATERHEVMCGHQCVRTVNIRARDGEILPIPLCLSDKADGRMETQVKHPLAKTVSPVCGPSFDTRDCNEMIPIPINDGWGVLKTDSFQSVLKRMGIEIDLKNPHGSGGSKSC